MIKLRATKKEIRDSRRIVLKVHYCELQTLLTYRSPFAYSCGRYGWSCDYYDIDGVVISTGYSAIGDIVNYDLVREYEKKAEKIRAKSKRNTKEKLDALLKEFITKAVKNK